ncbi:MAG: VWA domain-containing protein [Gammaproteobacteria bacterium]|nr:VWA domain-containing protein [Gammaproteobacteria bacterium]
MLEDFHFLRPYWLLALIAVAALWFVASRARGGANRWRDAVASDLLEVLLDSDQGERIRTLQWAVAATLACTVIALSGPTFERLPQRVEQREDGLVIVMDLSLSMYAEDVQPSRVERAKHKITDVLRGRDEGFTALVAYAGDAHTVAPLTDDVRTIQNLLAALRPEMMPVLGSRPGPALKLARGLLDNAGLTQGRILLVTDGVDRISDVTRYADRNFPISILGIGTAAGASIPLNFVDQPGRYLQNEQGTTIHAKLDDDRLATVAKLCHGRYSALTIDDSDIDALISVPLPAEEETVQVNRNFDAWHDVGYVLLLPVLLAALFGFRRGVFAVLAITMLMPDPVHADFWDDLWQRRDQQAHQALQQGAPDRASQLFEDTDWRSVAEYRNDQFGAAAAGFNESDSIDGRYNLGTALAHMGALPEAIQAYDQTLVLDPNHADAAFNKALLEKLLEQQQQSADNDQTQQDSSSASDGEQAQDSQNEGSPSGDEGADQNSEDPRQRQEDEQGEERDQDPSQEQMAETEADARDENKDAIEQWLRRVPDDPGGLLKRKFQYETNQRLRRGDYANRQTDRIW